MCTWKKGQEVTAINAIPVGDSVTLTKIYATFWPCMAQTLCTKISGWDKMRGERV